MGPCGADTPVRELYPREETPTSDNSFHNIRNHRPPTRPYALLYVPHQLRLPVIRINNHLAISNLLITRALKAQFADSQPAFRSHGRTKRAAGHRPSVVEIAQPRLRIEHRTRFIIGKLRKALFRLRTFIKHARSCVARKIRRQPPHRFSRPQANTPRPPRVRLLKGSQPALQPRRVQLIDRKHTHAALRASRTTHQPLAATPRNIGQSSVHNLNQRAIPSRQSPQRHPGSITHSPCGADTPVRGSVAKYLTRRDSRPLSVQAERSSAPLRGRGWPHYAVRPPNKIASARGEVPR